MDFSVFTKLISRIEKLTFGDKVEFSTDSLPIISEFSYDKEIYIETRQRFTSNGLIDNLIIHLSKKASINFGLWILAAYFQKNHKKYVLRLDNSESKVKEIWIDFRESLNPFVSNLSQLKINLEKFDWKATNVEDFVSQATFYCGQKVEMYLTNETEDFFGNNILDTPSSQDVESIFTSFRLVSLLDMVKQLNLCDLLQTLNIAESSIEALFKETLDYGQGLKMKDSVYGHSFAEDFITILRRVCDPLEMPRTNERLDTLKGFVDYQKHFATQSNLVREMREVISAIHRDLADKLFLYIPNENARYYNQEDLFGIKDTLPETNDELKEAGLCYMTGAYTACVFHLMRAVEIGFKSVYLKTTGRKKLLYGHDKKTGKPLYQEIELCDWQKLLTGLHLVKKGFELKKRKSLTQKKKYSFYCEIYIIFENFKDAWRNTISHGQEIRNTKTYLFQKGQTSDIIRDTERFLKLIAENLKNEKESRDEK